MNDIQANTYTSFNGYQRTASGSLETVALSVKKVIESDASASLLTFDNATGRLIQIDTRGSDEDVLARLAPPAENQAAQADIDTPAESRGRGRPKLGVVAREVTLLPRHWDWLASQPGGASVALRKLVDEARRTNSDKDRNRKAQDRAYRFMSAVAGNFVNFEEATRALFANDQARLSQLISEWPDDVRTYTLTLAFGDDNFVSS